jgi:nitrous oxidase accessory protein NosD
VALCPWTFTENVVITKEITVQSLYPEHRAIVQAANPRKPVFFENAFPPYYYGKKGVTTLKDLVIRQATQSAGVKIGGEYRSTTVSIQNCRIILNRFGVFMQEDNKWASSRSQTHIENSEIRMNSEDGVHMENYSYLRLTSNLITGNDGSGVYLGPTISYLIQDNAIWQNGKEGLMLYAVKGTIESNEIYSNGGHGIFIDNTQDEDKNGDLLPYPFIKMWDNQVHDNQGHGFYHRMNRVNATDFTDFIERNTIEDNAGHGIRLEVAGEKFDAAHSEDTGGRISSNIIRRNHQNGVDISKIDDVHFSDNRIEYNQQYGINLTQVADYTFRGDAIGSHTKDGVHVENSLRLSFQKNTIRLNANGLVFRDVLGLTITDAQIRENQGYGIYINYCVDGDISHNHIVENCGGVRLENMTMGFEVHDNVVARNRCTSSQGLARTASPASGMGLGLWVDNSASIQVESNKIADNGSDGVRTSQGADPQLRRNNIQDNDGYALNNQDASVTVDAQENWWGDAAGPGGAITGGVDAANWLTEPVAVVAAPERDKVVGAVGGKVFNTLYLNNLAVMSDTLRISLNASRPWSVLPSMPQTLTIEGDAWARLPFTVTIPTDAAIGAVDAITLTVSSVAHPEQEDVASFRVEVGMPLYLPITMKSW